MHGQQNVKAYKLVHFITGKRGNIKTSTGWTMRFQAYFLKVYVLNNFIPEKGSVA